MKQKSRKNACEIFHDKANFAALTPSGFPVGGIVIVGISQNYFL